MLTFGSSSLPNLLPGCPSELAAQPPLSVTFTVTADDLYATSRMAARDAWPVIHILAAMLIIGGLVLLALKSPIVGALLIGSGIGVSGLALVPAFWRFWLGRRAAILLGEERHFVFDAEGIHEERTGIRHTTPWTLLTEMRITTDGVFLLHHYQLVLTVPARGFPSPDAMDRLISLASAHAPNVRIS